MTRRIPGLSQATLPISEVPDGLYLVRVERMQYRWDKQKPYYAIRLAVCEPKQFAGTSCSARLYCTPKALWKLSWFLRDFGYDTELLGRDELDEKRLLCSPASAVISTSYPKASKTGSPRKFLLNDNAHRRLQLKPAAYNALRRRVLERDRWQCQVCGNRQQLDIHHLIPRSRDGSDSQDD